MPPSAIRWRRDHFHLSSAPALVGVATAPGFG
jgi:hypothetical protein